MLRIIRRLQVIGGFVLLLIGVGLGSDLMPPVGQPESFLTLVSGFCLFAGLFVFLDGLFPKVSK